METYVSAISWASRGFARRMPREQELTPEVVEDMRREATEAMDDEQVPNNFAMGDLIEQAPDDDYPVAFEELSDDQLQDFIIKQTDALVLAGKVDKEFSSIQIYIYEQQKNNIYVHHEIQLSAFPLALQWVGFKNGQKANLVCSATFLPEIQIWDLDSMNQVEPIAMLGGSIQAAPSKVKKFKKQQKKFRPGSHTDAVLSLHINPQHRHVLASGSADTSVKLWDLQALNCVHTFNLHSQRVQVVRWNPSQKEALFSLSADSLLNVYDSRSPGTGVSTKLGLKTQTAAWNPASPTQVAVACQNGQIQLYEVRKLGAPLLLIQAHEETVSGIAFVKKGILTSCSFDESIKVWDTVGGECLAQKFPKAGQFHTISAFQDELGVVAAGDQQGQLFVWDICQIQQIEAKLKQP